MYVRNGLYTKLMLVVCVLFVFPSVLYSTEIYLVVKKAEEAIAAKNYVHARKLFEQACMSGDLLSCQKEEILAKLERVDRDINRAQQREKQLDAEMKQVDKQIGVVDKRLDTNQATANNVRNERDELAGKNRRLDQQEQTLNLEIKRADARIKLADLEAERAEKAYKALLALENQDFHNARTLFQQACDLGDPESCSELGMMLVRGQGGPKDDRSARILFDQSCSEGGIMGCVSYGFMLQRGEGGAVDIEKAQSLFNHACQRGFKMACDNLMGR